MKWLASIFQRLFAGVTYFLLHENILSEPGVLVETNSGQIQGISSFSRDGREFYEWLGIPYAQPPVGPLRFEAPVPVEKWDGIRDGSQYGGICAQMDIIVLIGVISGVEDCLFLNIHAPKIANEDYIKKKSLLPVIVYFHGGYFAAGSSNSFRPDYFMDEDVILVTLNYRLGVLGFLSTGDSTVRGNMGLKDQSMALKWVHQNIENFGGDPNQITIFGESAGAASVHYHLMSPMSRGLMSKAISQSGTALNPFVLYEDPASQATNFAKQFNCPTNKSSSKMVKCLRKIDIYKLLEGMRRAVEPSRTKDKIFVPVVESVVDEQTFLPDHPLNLMRAGKQANIPWLTAVNADDGLIFAHPAYKNTTFRRLLERNWNILDDSLLFLRPQEKQFNPKIKTFYFGNDSGLYLLEDFTNLTNLVTDRQFANGLYKSILTQAKSSPIYLFYYNKVGPSFWDLLLLNEGKYPPLIDGVRAVAMRQFRSIFFGQSRQSFVAPVVCHGDELVMLFNIPAAFSIPRTDPNYKFSKDFVKLFSSFASKRDNNDYKFRNTSVPRVPATISVNDELKCLEIKDRPEVKTLPILKRLQFWESLENEY